MNLQIAFNCMHVVGWQNVNPRAAFQATLDTATIISMLQDIRKDMDVGGN